MKTLILGGMTIEDPKVLAEVATNRGWQVVELRPTNSFTDGFKAIKDPVIYAAPGFAEKIAKALNVNLVTVSEDWLSDLTPTYTRRYIKKRLLFDDLSDLKFPCFIKPAVYKVFKSQVYESENHLREEIKASCKLIMNCPIYTQNIVEWEVEYRCFVSKNKLQTCAPYRRDMKTNKYDVFEGEIEACEEVINQMARTGHLPKTGALDIGKIKNSGWAVIELNGAYGSGIYKLTDPEKVLDVLEETTYK